MNGFKEEFKELIDDIFFPKNPVCSICKRVLFISEDAVCERCFERLMHIKEGVCIKCMKNTMDNNIPICTECNLEQYNFSSGSASFIYNEYSEKLIWDFKYENNRYAAQYAARLMCDDLIKKEWLKDIDLITCVPSSNDKTTERGYNQSEVISQEISRILAIELENRLLRVKDGLEDQIGKNYKQRFINVKDKYEYNSDFVIKNKTLLIIDDVFTSGATLSECTKRLLEAGATKTYFAVFASAIHNNKER